ncbi:MAG: hypothetical protein ACREDC_03255 [Bradyrhizobium sp.]
MMKSNARSALILAIGLCAGLAATSRAATREGGHAAILIAQAGGGPQPTGARPPAERPAIAPDRLTAADRALRDPGVSSPAPAATTAAGTAPPAASTAATDDGHSLWGKTSLIGKIFVGIGAVLTLASAARMFMT